MSAIFIYKERKKCENIRKNVVLALQESLARRYLSRSGSFGIDIHLLSFLGSDTAEVAARISTEHRVF